MLRAIGISLFAASLFAAMATPLMAADCPAPRESNTTEFGDHRRPHWTIDHTDNRNRTYPGSDSTRTPPLLAAFQRFRVMRKPETSATGWTVTLRDEQQRVLQVLRPSHFTSEAATTGVWTRFVKASAVTFDVFAEPGAVVALIAKEAIVLSDKAYIPRYSWLGPTAAYVPLYSFRHTDFETVRRAGDRVAFIVGRDEAEMNGAFRGVSWCCSGILLTDTLLLTNWHCGGRSMARPDEMWRDDSDGRICDSLLIDMARDDASPSREARCTKVEHVDKSRDYALLRVAPVGGGLQTLSTGRPVRFARTPLQDGARLRIIHHPECLEKRISFNCPVSQRIRAAWDGDARNPQSEFAHLCDTEGGSSGAPVFNEASELVGLHHLGHELIPGDPRQTCDKQNKAIHIEAVMSDIKAGKPDLYREIRAATDGLPE